MAFGNHLKRLRLQANLKVYELGSKLAMDQSLVSKYEQGTRLPTKINLQKITRFFKQDYHRLAKMVAKDRYGLSLAQLVGKRKNNIRRTKFSKGKKSKSHE